ncbi:MAG: hypothetical protein ACRD18_08995 [Terriglobia bacterium]
MRHVILPAVLAAIAALLPAQSQSGITLRKVPAASADYWAGFPPPPLMTGIGNDTLKITTRSSGAQAYFTQGLRLLHCFWWFEAYRAFRQASQLDPSAAMPYWGMAEALTSFPAMGSDARAAIENAKSRMGAATDHEEYYIRAAADEIEIPGDRGRKESIHEMETLIERFPDDVNAQAFLALTEMSGHNPDGSPREGEMYSQMLLRNILASHPRDAAANHYWIHAVEDGPQPQEALKSAELVPQLAPNSAHMVHMAGHIYYRLGEWEAARQAFLASMRVDDDYMASERIRPWQDVNYAHNLSYLVAACAEEGRYAEAMRWASKLRGLRASPIYGEKTAVYAISTGDTRLRLDLRFGNWQAAARDPVDFGAGLGQSASSAAKEFAQGWRLFARAMAALHAEQGVAQIGEATRDAAGLKTLTARMQKEVTADPRQGQDGSKRALALLKTAAMELAGNVQGASGNNQEAIALLKSAVQQEKELGYSEPPYYARPVEESLGEAYLKAHEWKPARAAYRAELRLRPASGFALYGIARSYDLEGSLSQAASAYHAFLAQWAHADRDLPQLRRAQAWLRRH